MCIGCYASIRAIAFAPRVREDRSASTASKAWLSSVTDTFAVPAKPSTLTVISLSLLWLTMISAFFSPSVAAIA